MHTDQVRRFNRLVTLRAGALDGSYLGRGRPLGQARFLFEIGPQGDDLRRLRERLGLDSGYASRLLTALSASGLVLVEEDGTDRRRRRVSLTAKGLAERAAYDTRSDELARSLLEPLEETQRARLVKAMAEVEALMTAASVAIDAEPQDSEDARRCVRAYFAELNERFEGGFDPDRGGYAGRPAKRGSDGCFLIARLEGEAVGCGALVASGDGIGEIKRMWVAAQARGLGLSSRLLRTLEEKASTLGMSRLRLDTNRTLVEAQSLYRKAGYREIARYNDNSYADFWFEKELEA